MASIGMEKTPLFFPSVSVQITDKYSMSAITCVELASLQAILRSSGVVSTSFSTLSSCSGLAPLEHAISTQTRRIGGQVSAWAKLRGRGFAAQPHSQETSQPSSSIASIVDCAPSPGTAPPCWNCGVEQDQTQFSFFCKDCNVIQPKRQNADHYAVLGLPLRHFDLTQTDLEARYKNLQRLLHPDKFSTKGQQERTYSDDQASLVNVAYHTLKDPLRRANYLLNGTGIGCGEGFEGTIADPELLMEVMERREEIESTSDKAQLQTMREGLATEKQVVVQQLSDAFKGREFEAAAHRKQSVDGQPPLQQPPSTPQRGHPLLARRSHATIVPDGGERPSRPPCLGGPIGGPIDDEPGTAAARDRRTNNLLVETPTDFHGFFQRIEDITRSIATGQATGREHTTIRRSMDMRRRSQDAQERQERRISRVSMDLGRRSSLNGNFAASSGITRRESVDTNARRGSVDRLARKSNATVVPLTEDASEEDFAEALAYLSSGGASKLHLNVMLSQDRAKTMPGEVWGMRVSKTGNKSGSRAGSPVPIGRTSSRPSPPSGAAETSDSVSTPLPGQGIAMPTSSDPNMHISGEGWSVYNSTPRTAHTASVHMRFEPSEHGGHMHGHAVAHSAESLDNTPGHSHHGPEHGHAPHMMGSKSTAQLHRTADRDRPSTGGKQNKVSFSIDTDRRKDRDLSGDVSAAPVTNIHCSSARETKGAAMDSPSSNTQSPPSSNLQPTGSAGRKRGSSFFCCFRPVAVDAHA